MKKRYQFKNRIWIIAASVLVALTTTLNVQAAVFSSVALEQQVRCGLEEHIHTRECYLDELLVCTKKAHTHSENCYLLLLEENNVNALLGTIETAEDNSLDTLIADVVNDAILYEDSALSAVPAASSVAEAWQRSGASSSGGWTFFTSASSSGQAGAASSTAVYAANTEGQVLEADIALLNENIVAANIQPYMVLNTGLTTMALTPEDTEPIGGITTLSLGQEAVRGNRKINFYIRLDGKLTCIGDGTLTYAYPAYYYSFSDTASLYREFLETSLTENNINQTYYFRYVSQSSYANPPTSFNKFNSYAGTGYYYPNRLTFGNSTDTRYAVLSWYRYNNSTDPVNFYTLNLNYTANGVAAANSAVYVEENYTYTLPESDDYYWVNANGNTVTSVALNQAATVYAKPKKVTVTYLNGVTGAELASFPLSPGAFHTIDPNRVLPQGHIWIDESGNRVMAASITVRKDTVFRSVPATYTVTYRNADGTQYDQKTAGYGETITLPDLPPGTSFWVDSGGGTYNAGDEVTVTKDLTFTAAARTMTITYDVNFPSYSGTYAAPTVIGGTSETVAQGNATSVHGLSAEYITSTSSTAAVAFTGWKVRGTDVTLQPGASMSWAALDSYADSSDSVTLIAQWKTAEKAALTFYINLQSASGAQGEYGSGNSKWTSELYRSYVGGLPEIDSTDYASLWISRDEGTYRTMTAYQRSQEIKKLIGKRESGIWIEEIPSDAEFFQKLVNIYGESGTFTINGVTYTMAQLNTEEFTVRWHHFKYVHSSGCWHMDGLLVKKLGKITVDKTFAGDEAAIAEAEKGFSILAQNGTVDASGAFTPYASTNANYKQYTLTLDNATTSDRKNHSYEWLIEGVLLNENWRITEYPTRVDGYSYYPEYSVYDTDGNITAVAEYGTQVFAVGKTFALDEDPDQGLMVDFRNYYYPTGSILIKKEDAKTGKPIGNAVFELWQNDHLLTFDYAEDTGQYVRNEDGNGSITQITTAADGFSIISTTGFSYEYGDVVVKEVQAPFGYDAAPNITLGRRDSTVQLIDLSYDNGTKVNEANWSDYAEVPNNDVLVVKNSTSAYTSLTVTKNWDPVNMAAESVVVALQANGARATNTFPGLENVEVTLNAANNWTYTWSDLPAYANGETVEWGIKEIKIGSTPTLADGKSFANWIATVTLLGSPDDNGDGVVDAWNYRVSNTPRRTMIRVTKTDEGGAVLPGATFTLVECDKSGTPVSGAATDTQVSDTNGLMTFDNLTAGHYYLLTETQPPGGYLKLLDSIILTVDGDGLVRQIKDGLPTDLTESPVIRTGAYNVRIINRTTQPLPETGGAGTNLYICSGLMLMLTAAGALWYKNKHRKEGQAPP